MDRFEARSDIKVFILKKNGTFLPSNPIRRISSNKIILMLAEEDWFMVTFDMLTAVYIIISCDFSFFIAAKN